MTKEKHPTIFAHDGKVMVYQEGTMLELYSQLSAEEWKEITLETVKYSVFIECIKTIAIPKLQEGWDEDDEWYLVQFDIAVSRMRNIDPLLMASYNKKEIYESYSKWISTNTDEALKFIQSTKEDVKRAYAEKYQIDETTKVSDL